MGPWSHLLAARRLRGPLPSTLRVCFRVGGFARIADRSRTSSHLSVRAACSPSCVKAGPVWDVRSTRAERTFRRIATEPSLMDCCDLGVTAIRRHPVSRRVPIAGAAGMILLLIPWAGVAGHLWSLMPAAIHQCHGQMADAAFLSDPFGRRSVSGTAGMARPGLATSPRACRPSCSRFSSATAFSIDTRKFIARGYAVRVPPKCRSVGFAIETSFSADIHTNTTDAFPVVSPTGP